MKKISAIVILFICISTLYAQENIVSFDNKWTVDLSMNYSLLRFQQNELFNCLGHKPIGLTIGAKYKNFGGSYTFQLPFLTEYYQPFSETFDLEFDYFMEKFTASLSFTRYKSFYIDEIFKGSILNNDKKVNLEILSIGASIRWVLNYRNHSLRGVYELNRQQKYSSGSFIIGLGVYYNSLYSDDLKLPLYETKQHYVSLAVPLVGYSYSWIFGSGFFLNADVMIGINNGLNFNNMKYEFMPSFFPNITLGMHQKTWSFSASINAKVFISVQSIDNNFQWYQLTKISSTFFKISKRF